MYMEEVTDSDLSNTQQAQDVISSRASQEAMGIWINPESPFSGRSICGSDKACVAAVDEFQTQGTIIALSFAIPIEGLAFSTFKIATLLKRADNAKDVLVVTRGLGDQNPLYKAAVQSFKNTDLSNAGRALTKHPEVIGQTKETLKQTLRTDTALNNAAHSALRDIMRNGVTTTPTLGRYGTVTQVQIPGGFGARWASDGSFIGFINP